MKKLSSILVLCLLWSGDAYAEVNKKDLNEFYNGCLDDAKRSYLHEEGLKICNCAINIISTQLNNEEFQRIFSGDPKTTDAWMREYLEPNCNFRRS